MSNSFDDFEFDDDGPAPTPDWLREMDDDKPGTTPPAAPTPAAPAPAPAPGIDLDRLREKTTRAGAMDDDMAADAPVTSEDGNGQGNFFSRMTPAQRLIIAVFFVVDVCVVGVGLLLLVGAI
jgi:hypothetical protein